MSKITEALKKASEERSNTISPMRGREKFSIKHTMGAKMRKSWFSWILIVGVVGVFIALNYQGGKDAVPLSEIFPDEEVFPVEVEYEFVQEEAVESNVEEALPVSREIQAVVPTQAPVKSLVSVKDVPVAKTTAYTIQIASFKDKQRAEEALVKIRTKVPSAYIGSRDLGAKGVWYRIYAGQFELRNEAEVTLGSIKKNYDSSFIISPRKAK